MSRRDKNAPDEAPDQPQVRRGKAAAPAPQPEPALAGVNLLPQEYYNGLKERRVLRLLGLMVVGLLLIGIAGAVGVGMLAASAKAELAAEQQRGTQLREERAQYGELTQVLAELDTARGAQAIALYAEIDWARVSEEFESSLPGGATTLSLNLGQRLSPGLGSPGITEGSEANPLSSLNVAFMEYQIQSTDLNAGPALLDRMESRLTGHVWGYQTSVTRDDDGIYTFSGIVRLGPDVVGTSRAKAIDEGLLEGLRASLEQASPDESLTSRGVE